MARLKDEIGNRYGKLTVIERATNDGTSAQWLCQCDCGGQIVTRGYHLRAGASRSCGKCSRSKKTGYGALSALISKYKSGARLRGLVFKLSREEVEELTSSPCHYCGKAPEMTLEYPGCNGAYVYNSIDRKDSSQGYITGNCVPSCKVCNRAKSDMSYGEFVQYLDDLAAFRSRG